MPIYKVQAPDGKVYRIQGPDGANPEDLFQAVAEQNPMAVQTTADLESAKSAPMSFGDTFKSLSSGVVGGGKSIVDFFGAGTDVSKGLGEAQSFLQQSLTPERKAEIARREELQDRAARSGSMLQEAKAFLGGVAEAPVQSLAQAAGSSVPAIAVGILALPVEAPAALAIGVGTIAKLTVGAMQGVGEYKGSVFDAVKVEYMKQGKSEKEAEALAIKSQEYSRDKAFEIGGSALLGALDAVTGAEPGVAKALRKAAPTGVLTKEAIEKGVAALPDKAIKAPSYLGQLAKGVATEAPLEGAQGAFGQYGENVALQPTGADVTPMQGVLGAGLRDAAVGALFGGTASPLSMKPARQEYATDQFLRQAKEDIELDKRAAESEKIKQQAREGLGATGKQLFLPAPGKTYEEPKDLLQDPVGRITEDELGKAIGDNTVVNYLNKYRRDNNLPKLKSYSVEDIKDAMTAQNPEGEEGALNSILAYKTGYKDETYTVDDINNVAVAKNVATETKGFSDFLTRATGKSDLNTMTQPELHSVAKALEALPRTGKEEQLVLPEGSNATRFTQDQYNQSVTTALMGVKQGKPVSLDQARNAVKAQTDLKTDRDADQVLKTAASNEDLIIERGTGFQAANKTGEVLGTYGTEAEARRNHRRADITPVETQLVRAPEEIKTEKTTQLPQGYGIEKTAEAGESGPAAYVVRVDGSQKNESQTFAEEVDAKTRLNALARGREANAKSKEAAADRIRQDLEKEQGKIVQMEADGLTGTSEHTKAVNAFKAANVTKSAQITSFLDEAEAFRTPLKVVPLGKKTAKVEKHTVIKGGKKLGTFPNKTEAEKSILAQADEQELQTIADRGGALGKRAEVELGERKRTTPGIKVKGTTEGLEKAGVRTQEVEAQLAELKAKLIPMLKKFGLEQVGLNVVRAIENDADGAWGKADKLIRIALQATKPIQTMRHEALHALKELGFFTPQQWEALKRQAEKTWVNTYLKGQMVEVNGKKMTRYDAYANGVKNDDGSWALKPLSPEDILEEAIADAFGSWEGGAKPPPGLMAALFKRMQQFFAALRQALTGAGFESAEEIFGKIEGGELKAGKFEEPSKIDSKMSLRQANYNKDPDRLEVSTARPTALRPMPGEIAPRDPIKDFYVIDSEDIMSVPAHMASAHNAISTYNWFPVSEDPNATIRAMKDTIVDNLVWLYNLTPENIRNRAKLWYNGANRIAKDWSKVYGYSLRQMAGVLAVLSPQKDWFMNTSLGERVVHVYTQRQNDKWSSDMTTWADSYVKAARDIETRDKRQVVFDAAKRLEGTKLKDMNIEDMAYFVRVFDETYHSRKYRVITPEGMFGDYVTVNEEVGEDEDASGGQGDVAWGTYDSIKKAISILQDGSQENISEQLGDEHKVRNFNNNIVDPDSASGSVTIDTHAVGAASFKALSGASLEVLHNFGTTPKGLVSAGGSAMTGASGTYGFIADAYREAAALVGVLPREMQSITWEAIRSIFPAAWKSQNASSVNAIYDRFKAGEITLKEARDEVLKISGGIKKFAWENDKSGAFPSTGATSFDVNKQDARVLQPYQIKEKLKINLSAAPSMEEGAEVVPGIKYLFGQTNRNDMAAYTLLQEVATDNVRHLLSGIENVKVTTVPASGLYDESFEPSVNLAVTFNYGEKGEVLPALKRFASNFKQKQIHVRQVSKLDVETEYDDGSYNTPVFTFKLEESFSRTEIKSIVRESGLPGITFTDNQVVAYFMRGKKSDTAEKFYGQIEKLAEQIGGFASAVDATVERLWVYGSGFGATQGYSAIKGNVRPGTGVTVKTAKRAAAYINNVRDGSIKTFDNADITDEQANKQNVIGDMYDKLPVYDMDRPIVRRAYEALAKALLEQYKVLPITVSWSKKKNKKGQPVDAYGSDSVAMRKDILENNRLQILPTTPDSFGPEGYDFTGHPLLEETGLKLDGQPLLYNDLLRAVHDYYAHGMTEVGFGPKGEEAAWKNHMSITKDPLARWALTMETRAQNSYVNFRSGIDRSKVPLNKRGFAVQKAALLPVQVALTGSSAVDKPMKEFIKTLTKDEKLGSAGDIKLVPGQKYSLKPEAPAKDQKLSLRQVKDIFDKAEEISEPPGVESIRQQWIGGVSGIGDRDSMYDLYRVNGSKKYIQDVQNFIRKELGDDFKGYRLMSNEELEELETGAMGSQFVSFTLNPDVARAFKNIPAYAEKTGMSVVEMDLTPEHVAMIGHPGELELVVDYGQGYNPSDVKVVEKYSLKTFFPTAEAAEKAAYKKAPPGTAEFKRFFGGSRVMEEGRPQVMYHASPNDFDVFRENKPIFVSPSASEAEYYGKRHRNPDKMDVNVYPLWVRAETPFDYDNQNHLARLGMYFGDDAVLMEEIADGNWDAIESPEVQDAIISLGHDSFYVNEGKEKNLAVLKANQVKSITGNIGDFSENKSIKFSLKPVSADIDAAIDRTTTAREDKGFIGRILEAIFPQSASHFRQQALNRYNQLGVYDRMLADKMGGAAFLADQSAESAALLSDLSASVTASAFGYGNRTGGVPVYRNGITTIDTSVKGPIAILAPLAKYNNPRIYQRYQFWAGVKRGKRFMADGKEKNFEQADIARAAQLEKEHPEFVQVQKEMNEFNNGLVKYMVQTGVIDPVRAKIYMEHADYIPFYRQMDGERTVGPNIFQSISGVKAPKALKGSEAPLADYLETIVRNTQSAIQSGMKNTAAQRAVGVAEKVGLAQRLNTQDSGPDTVQVLEKGVRVSYRVADPLFIDACRSLNLPDLPFMGLLAAPANFLRNLVTKDPGFMLANMMRDSLSSWVTSGANVTPIIGTISGFTKALSGKSASMEALLNAGILGGYEFSSGVLKSGEVLEADMNKKYGKATGAKALLKPFTSLWDALEKGTEASDAATRIAIYERVLADTGNEAEAIFRSLEVMNFNRKGSSAIIRIATAAIPFLNARMQGLDIFYRTAFGRDTDANAALKQKAFFVRGATLMALSVALFTMVSDDDEYKKQEEETKDNYWIIPGVGKFPIPFEVGFLFKTVPERIYAAMFKDDTGEDLRDSMKRGIISTLAFNPMPQTFKPLAEALVNYNSFTGRVIVGAGMEGRAPEFQVGPGTSEVAKQLGSALGLSPLKVDHVLQGYTGTIGMYLVQVTDSVLNANDNSPNASKRFEQLPIIKRFAVDPEARGNITQFYALKNATDQAVTTLNFLERSGDAEAYAKYFEENAGILANKDYVNSIEKQMKSYREMRAMIQSAEMSGDEKRDLLIDIGRAENALNENIKEVKKAIKELQ